jgi:hypothetical protein
MSDTTPERPHRTGLFWLDFVVALSAILISVVSLSIAVREDHTQTQLLAASTWPDLEYHTGNIENGKPTIFLNFRNAGVGPASVRWVTVEYRGRFFAHSEPLLAACCDPKGTFRDVVTDLIPRSVLVPHESEDFITVGPQARAAAAYAKLDRERRYMHVRACYCSILKDCWIRDSVSKEDPVPVKNCDRQPDVAYIE